MINISDTHLSPDCIHLLSRGLSFAPTHKTDEFQTKIDLYRFYRNLHLKAWYHNQPALTAPSSNTGTDSQGEREALKWLRNNDDLVIRQADKGGGTVVWGHHPCAQDIGENDLLSKLHPSHYGRGGSLHQHRPLRRTSGIAPLPTKKDKLYKQTRGTAMGAAYAPNYAGLYLGLWEERSRTFTSI